MVRLYESTLDFILENEQLALPPDVELGNLAFVFKEEAFALSAFSGSAEDYSSTSRYMFIDISEQDVTGVLQRLRYSDTLEIVFPDETGVRIGLQGSDAALMKAFACWSQRETGSGGVNPFAGGAGRNPFE